MATINIGQSNQDDQFYRYKMPRLQARVSLADLRDGGCNTAYARSCVC